MNSIGSRRDRGTSSLGQHHPLVVVRGIRIVRLCADLFARIFARFFNDENTFARSISGIGRSLSLIFGMKGSPTGSGDIWVCEGKGLGRRQPAKGRIVPVQREDRGLPRRRLIGVNRAPPCFDAFRATAGDQLRSLTHSATE